MTNDQANEVATKIKRTWTTGPHIDTWAEAVAELEFTRSLAAYRQLRDNHEGALSIATFKMAYRALHTDRTPETLPDCEVCVNTGWEQVEETIHDHPYKTARPCTCQRGAAFKFVHSRIVNDNVEALRRVFPGRYAPKSGAPQEPEF